MQPVTVKRSVADVLRWDVVVEVSAARPGVTLRHDTRQARHHGGHGGRGGRNLYVLASVSSVPSVVEFKLMLSASLYIIFCSARNRIRVRLRRLREPQYLFGAIAGGVPVVIHPSMRIMYLLLRFAWS